MRSLVLSCAIALSASCAPAAELGLASFYGAAGMTAAHRSLPMGTQVRVINLDNGRVLVVRIADRGPFIRGRIIDVSTAAAESLGFRSAGLAHVRIERVPPEPGDAGLRLAQAAAPASAPTSAAAICRYGADRLEHLQDDAGSGVGALSGDGPGCEHLRFPLFALAQQPDDLAPFAARGGAFLTETEAAASISVSALAEAPGRGEALRSGLLRFAQRSKGFAPAPLAAYGEAVPPETEAAADIPVNALAQVPERAAAVKGSASGCDAGASCERPKPGPASNPVLLFFARLRHAFD
ncbi:rare lipoprotein A [Roseiarcus fermentans]|uniref:Endolytic peptidoglycan transglycosylase RlpA n=1 Tax=Roseiarcus fermentans TaxID=1473586 RepID=A0A366FHK0_9HYPH|nr:rare lipoprotein A [Roseiarcus fermentans]